MQPQSRRLSTPLLAGLLAACAMSFAAGAKAQETVSVEDARGTQEVPLKPQTVVVFDMASLDTLGALGVEVAGVPQVALPDYLQPFAEVEKVGSLFEPDLEAVNALQPDLIIVGGRSGPKAEALSAIAPTLDMTVDQQHFVASAEKNVKTLATVFGKEAQADTALEKLDASIEGLRAKADKAGSALIVLTTGNKMSAYGKGSRFGVLHDTFGFQPADPNLAVANHGEAISFEYIAETNPDWLFVIDRDAAIGRGAAAAMLDNELVGGTKAWKGGQVVYLTPANWYLIGGGLQAMQQNVDQITQALDKSGQ